ncbi:hypothetical protein D9756_010683 [Leucocoprinus leucothites]|uniref:PEBP-like protein n=1 Tax=Leucocoprinus leucothites TaxID=201217 RepID=A0A8H5CUH9_9AGAR|nr:hypothetical protein D9756_010683 [Leucoagaricus leucothites]
MSLTTDLITTLSSHQIIPDVLPSSVSDTFTPTAIFTVVYSSGIETDLGNTVVRSKVLEEPEIRITPLNAVPGIGGGSGGKGEKDVKYTLVMTDPDAPSRAEPKFRQWRHWVITGLEIPNVQPQNATEVVYALKTKAATTPYWPPGPPPGSGLHRYTFLLFQEPEGGISVPDGAVEYGAKLEERRSWNAIKFANEYGLKLVGANFFLCQE